MNRNLGMELRAMNLDEGVLEGIIVPYDETSYSAGDPNGERVVRRAFAKSAQEQTGRLKLFRNHDQSRPIGYARRINARHPDGLWAEFKLAEGERYADVRDELAQGLLTDLSMGFRALQERRATDGAREITEAQLVEASLVPIGAYSGARVLALRSAAPNLADVQHAPPLPRIPDWMLRRR